MNLFKYTDSNKRYYTLDYFYKHKFNSKVFKVSLNAGFSCPNKDEEGNGGCIYCSKLGSGDFAGDKSLPLEEQFESVKRIMLKKWPNSKYIGYFQANTNTYDTVDNLKDKYERILKLDNVIGLNIATRPDAISDECYDYLEELNKRTFLTVELGLQTIHEHTSKLINRGHDLKSFEKALDELRKRKINVVVHIINGLPYETKEEMIETAKYLGNKDIQGIKIHMLHILKDTALANLYYKEKFHVLTKEEYTDIVCDQLEYLKEDIVINRITGDPDPKDLIEPTWLIKKFGVLNSIDKELAKRNTYQGFRRSILNYVKKRVIETVKEKDIVVDATIGNGFDTLFLSNIAKKGKVFGFDIQDEAIKNTDKLLKDNQRDNYVLFKESHENILNILKDYEQKISLILFNLGYLPGGNKEITTKKESTVKAIADSIKLLNDKGIILVVIYPHQEGKKEEKAIKELIKENKLNFVEYHNTDNENAPYLIEIKKTVSSF